MLTLQAFGMQRLYTKSSLMAGEIITFSEEAAHYLRHVLRLNAGDDILCFNENDGEWLLTCAMPNKKSCNGTVRQQTKPPQPLAFLALYFAPIKKAPMDWLIEKATELGVTDLYPTITERTQRTDLNIERLQKIAIEAAEQSGRLCCPTLHPTQPLSAMLANWPEEKPLLWCAEAGETKPLKEILAKASLPPAILVGPEGGFAASELSKLQSLAFVKPVSLGALILRAETAALSALACVQSHCGSWSQPIAPRPPYNPQA